MSKNVYDLQNFAKLNTSTQVQYIKDLKDPIIFAEKLLGIELFDYQKDILNYNGSRLHIRKGRQIGASYILAVKAVHLAITKPYITIAVISPSQRQSSLVFKYIKDLFFKHELLTPEISGSSRYSQTAIELSNGSIIYSLPCGSDGRTIRGISIGSGSLMIVDEASFIPEKVWAAIEFFTATGGQEILSSTPLAKHGRYYDASIDPDFEHIIIPSWRNPLISKEWIESKKKSASYDSEIAAEFTDSEGKFFPQDVIMNAIDYNLDWKENPAISKGHNKYMGVDLGIESDPTVVTIVKEIGNVLIPCFIEAYKKDNNKDSYELEFKKVRSYDDIVQDIYKVKELYDVTYASVDATNNAYVSETLEKQMVVFPIKFNSTTKNGNPMKTELMHTLLAALTGERLRIPNHPTLIRQLTNYEFTITENKNYKFSPTDEDFIDSLALAIYNKLAIKEPDIFGVA